MSVTVVGSANIDVVSRVERIPGPGETVLARSVTQVVGGKGSNQALAAARSGAETTFVCALGDDAGADLIARVHAASGVRLADRRTASPTGTAYITVDDQAENTIVVSSGANTDLAHLSDDDLRDVTRASVLLLQLETPLGAVQQAARAARVAGVTTVLNASPVVDGLVACLADVDVLLVNEHEVVQIAELVRDEPAGSVDQAAALLADRGHIVIVTLGADGVLLATRDTPPRRLAAFRVHAVDTTGAGDTFCGAFAAALARRTTDIDADALVSAIEWAGAAAALSVQTPGAEPSIPVEASIRHLLG